MQGINALILVTALAVAGGCAGGSSPATPPPATTPPPVATGTPVTTEARQTVTTWASSPTTVPHSPAVPPVPVVTGVRYAAHDGYDRVVLDIPGAPPGYSVKYVPEVRRDGSGEPVSIPGKAFLLITLHPAQAHRENGTPTVTGIHRTGLAHVQAYGIVGDYEGYVSIALGVDRVRNFHVGELNDRIYLDVAV
ncbi:AMIN-like domain-containing (lipo)protein [Actinoplanes subtropicus]|uniref:AMIN-like domain-containing (lipo)protein n=1 Tax=Actinoplanes subtropicus TaxID=543632 RepID=UPI00068EC278|nr:hypothetical protein [Actinoplanes subtropicus]